MDDLLDMLLPHRPLGILSQTDLNDERGNVLFWAKETLIGKEASRKHPHENILPDIPDSYTTVVQIKFLYFGPIFSRMY